ncbi:MAG TPA: BrnT family toxin [Rhodospirillales bacterium]|nr:BrnT family toxin [Rhodospirillales bacterium]
MKVEYDQAKRLAAIADRGIDFEDAPLVFNGPRRITWTDNRQNYGEDREITMGELAGRLVVIVHTTRDEVTRIISMRKANEREIRWFEEQFAED